VGTRILGPCLFHLAHTTDGSSAYRRDEREAPERHPDATKRLTEPPRRRYRAAEGNCPAARLMDGARPPLLIAIRDRPPWPASNATRDWRPAGVSESDTPDELISKMAEFVAKGRR
jgi:hypothetical protein